MDASPVRIVSATKKNSGGFDCKCPSFFLDGLGFNSDEEHFCFNVVENSANEFLFFLDLYFLIISIGEGWIRFGLRVWFVSLQWRGYLWAFFIFSKENSIRFLNAQLLPLSVMCFSSFFIIVQLLPLSFIVRNVYSFPEFKLCLE